ncbi:unnamed protein product [Arabidopsis arenosa]|uniref:Ubiquitin-like domain-containing protein n=1 Tax=Arabidopsis arenosa TaxID=38785 RepID=A0A8S2B375_ARAAE|nr:unnamed protein product [Arabidopsis arenosa]
MGLNHHRSAVEPSTSPFQPPSKPPSDRRERPVEIMSTTSRVGSNEVKIEGKKRKVVSEPTHVTLKVKGQDEEEFRVFWVRRNVKLLKMMEVYTKMRGVEWNTFRFLFDGSRIREYHTPDELELKDGDEIDAMLYQQSGFGPSSLIFRV